MAWLVPSNCLARAFARAPMSSSSALSCRTARSYAPPARDGNQRLGAAAPVTRSLPHVVIVGGGFGGLYAARALAHRPVRVTLLDRRNHHLFQPLLYQVATAALNASDIAVPLRSVLRKATNVTVLLAEI